MYYLCFLLALVSQTVFADAYKCRSSSGQSVISERPCDGGYSVTSSARSDNVDSEADRRAQADLQRQREWLSNRESEQNRPVQSSGVASPVRQNNIPALQACLMKVTATQGLGPVSEARSKVSCYALTVGLIDDCHRSVAATLRLTTAQENSIKSMCR